VKCRTCRQGAVIDLRRHNAAFCRAHFIDHIHRQVERTIHDHRMFSSEDRLLLGVSGGKDSLALWAILTELGYRVDGVYLDLGIGEYSTESLDLTRGFAASRGLDLRVIDLPADEGFSVPEAARAGRRSPCSACGLSKRYLLNKVADDLGYDVLVMGHNLDDEAATLLANVLGWQTDYLARQRPVLPATEGGLVRKVKPLVRVAERETAAYAILQGIDYEVEECPMAGGNTINRYKKWLDGLEEESPGLTTRFLTGFFDRGQASFATAGQPELRVCGSCGQPTTGEVCAFCHLRRLTLESVAR
jgi:uncharacterized protein (TIGR00269 family)